MSAINQWTISKYIILLFIILSREHIATRDTTSSWNAQHVLAKPLVFLLAPADCSACLVTHPRERPRPRAVTRFTDTKTNDRTQTISVCPTQQHYRKYGPCSGPQFRLLPPLTPWTRQLNREKPQNVLHPCFYRVDHEPSKRGIKDTLCVAMALHFINTHVKLQFH